MAGNSSELSIITDDTIAIKFPLARGKETNLFFDRKHGVYYVSCRECGSRRDLKDVDSNGHPTDWNWNRCFHTHERRRVAS